MAVTEKKYGKFWKTTKIDKNGTFFNTLQPKKGKKKTNKTITISILKPIPSGLAKENFIQILEKNIYSELDIIN